MKHQMMIPKPSDLMEVEALDWSDGVPPSQGAMYDVMGDIIPSFNLFTINLCSIIHHGHKKFKLHVPDTGHPDYAKYEEALKKIEEDRKRAKEEAMDSEGNMGMARLSPSMGIHPAPPMKEEIIECTEITVFPAITFHINMPYKQFNQYYLDFLERKHLPID